MKGFGLGVGGLLAIACAALVIVYVQDRAECAARGGTLKAVPKMAGGHVCEMAALAEKSPQAPK
jgi:hypothetical protein